MAWRNHEEQSADSDKNVHWLLRAVDEKTRIRFQQKGYYFGPRALVSPRDRSRDALDIDPSFDLDALPVEELKLAVDLGILTMNVLTQAQRRKVESAPDAPLERGVAISLLGKLAASSSLPDNGKDD